jgi:hypothetical protein
MDYRNQDTLACKTARIRHLNDEFRKTGKGGTMLITPGIQQMGADLQSQIWNAIQTYSDFSEHNDPYNEHDFGAIMVDEETIFWKIDCYNADKTMGSPDPADDGVTARVMTIIKGCEY